MDSLRAVTEDDAFHLPSAEAARALQVASTLVVWASSSAETCARAKQFGETITTSLKECISSAIYTNSSSQEALNRRCLWSSYHTFITSTQFTQHWADFLRHAVNETSCAILQQFVTQRMMNTLIIEAFPLPSACPTGGMEELSSIEENALRYASGYVLRSSKSKITTMNHPMLEALLYGISEMSEEDHVEDNSTDWLDKINRGGLIFVSHNTYRFFYYVEMELRKHFNHQNTTCMTEGFRSKVLDLVSNDVDVLHAWCVCQRDMEDEERTELLKIILSTYITVRGFSFTRSFMELYKQLNSKTIQKSKALRKNIGST